jgi:hypothetical protein
VHNAPQPRHFRLPSWFVWEASEEHTGTCRLYAMFNAQSAPCPFANTFEQVGKTISIVPSRSSSLDQSQRVLAYVGKCQRSSPFWQIIALRQLVRRAPIQPNLYRVASRFRIGTVQDQVGDAVPVNVDKCAGMRVGQYAGLFRMLKRGSGSDISSVYGK